MLGYFHKKAVTVSRSHPRIRTISKSHQEDLHGSRWSRTLIMYDRNMLTSTVSNSCSKSISKYQTNPHESVTVIADNAKQDVQRISNSVQAQIEKLFTDVVKDATSIFAVTCLGSIPLKDKVTSLQGLQAPLLDLYLKEFYDQRQQFGTLEICGSGLRVQLKGGECSYAEDTHITPFQNIAVWSAVKFTISPEHGGAGFLPLITCPENIDKTSLFQPLSTAERNRMLLNQHTPIFAVVMRSAEMPKSLECHGFVCSSIEDAIFIAATLYQNLMAHVSSNSYRRTRRRTPRNQNGVSCISIASSFAVTDSNCSPPSFGESGCPMSSFENIEKSGVGVTTSSVLSWSGCKKQMPSYPLTLNNNGIAETTETFTKERKRKSHKSVRIPPIPTTTPGNTCGKMQLTKFATNSSDKRLPQTTLLLNKGRFCSKTVHSYSPSKSNFDCVYKVSKLLSDQIPKKPTFVDSSPTSLQPGESTGDILTRVAIPRSGSFLNAGGLTRYKSKAVRRSYVKTFLGGKGGGSPLGFSELFNEFRSHENLHSLDDILYAIIDADGMSFNDLKPIYKEFLLKLAVTLTKDELFQRSKNIMRRQKKKNFKSKVRSSAPLKKTKPHNFFSKSLKKVFQLGQFSVCHGKHANLPNRDEFGSEGVPVRRMLSVPAATINSDLSQCRVNNLKKGQRYRSATSSSDVSVIPLDHPIHALNRNSSSGYVSCSECSYDSESCTCKSADRCYCSLSNVHMVRKKLPSSSENSFQGQTDPGMKIRTKRDSLITCKSDDKCYCSLEALFSTTKVRSQSSSFCKTWCDIVSCVRTKTCTCQRSKYHSYTRRSENIDKILKRKSRSLTTKTTNKLALDYELFNIPGSMKSVQPHEALSVKKSVEAAAVFADVKLSQTTDIKSLLCSENSNSVGRNDTFPVAWTSLSPNLTNNSYSADDILKQLSFFESNIARATSVQSGRSRIRAGDLRESFQNIYQLKHAATLEDTLGYLP